MTDTTLPTGPDAPDEADGSGVANTGPATSGIDAMMETSEERTSTLLRRFRRDLPDGRVSLGDLLGALGDRQLGTVLLALSLPTVSPIPLGISVLCNTPLLFFALRLAFGSELMLPGWMLKGSIRSGTAAKVLDAAIPKVSGIEGMLRPRLRALGHLDERRGFGALVLVLAIVAFVPVPLMGWLPGIALVIMSLGLIERDGVAVAISLGFGVAALVVGAILVGGLSYAGQELLTGEMNH